MKTNLIWYRGLHAACALAFPLLLTLLIGCKRAKERPAELGPEVAANVIEEALAKIVNDASLDSMHTGQYVNYSITRRLENEENTIALGGTTVSVIGARPTSDPAQTNYILQINRSYRQSDGSFKNVTTEDDSLVIRQPPRLSSLVAGAQVRALAGKPVVRVSFHGFEQADDVLPLPEKIKSRPDCGGISPCELNVHYIRFDMVTWYSETDFQKVSFNFGFSTRTPLLPFGDGFERFTGLMVSDCRAAYIDVGPRNVYVRDCQQLDDFQK